MIETEYAIVPVGCTGSGVRAARMFVREELAHFQLTCGWAETSLLDWYPEVGLLPDILLDREEIRGRKRVSGDQSPGN
jgi:hypothetical protein